MNPESSLKSIYRHPLALLSDLYEFTMAYGYWKEGIAEREAVFNLFFRRHPFGGTFAVAAGIEVAIDYLMNFHFEASDLAYLEKLDGGDGKPLFEAGFLDYLSRMKFTCHVDAVPEGTAVFPYEPLIRVQGPILQAQLFEPALLNIINFQTLIATKAARICWAAHPDPVVEFGLRRAQGIDGAISATRAAFIGGCESTSHLLGGKLFDIPVKGTQAHSWIMAFPTEEEAFRSFARSMPNNCVLLVDTYDSIGGVKNAIKIATEMRKNGIEMLGIRLDSGDLTRLSIEARKMLDKAGFTKAKIMASNELDEYLIQDLKRQGAQITIWGVGTNLVTGKEQPALDGVYKLSALKDEAGNWEYKFKISDQLAKVTNPGIHQVRRYYNESGNIADMIYDVGIGVPSKPVIQDFVDPTVKKEVSPKWKHRDLLVPMVRKGKSVYAIPSLKKMQANTNEELSNLSLETRRLINPEPYFVGLEKGLYEQKIAMIKRVQKKR